MLSPVSVVDALDTLHAMSVRDVHLNANPYINARIFLTPCSVAAQKKWPGKTNQDNFKLLKNLAQLKLLELPILAGISRKSMIYKTLKTNSISSINGTTALHMEALKNGAKVLRAHDIKEAQECIELHKNLII